MLTLRNLLVSTDVIAALPMFIAVDDGELRILPTPLSSIRRSVGVTMPKDRAPSAAAAALLVHLREEGATRRPRARIRAVGAAKPQLICPDGHGSEPDRYWTASVRLATLDGTAPFGS